MSANAEWGRALSVRMCLLLFWVWGWILYWKSLEYILMTESVDEIHIQTAELYFWGFCRSLDGWHRCGRRRRRRFGAKLVLPGGGGGLLTVE